MADNAPAVKKLDAKAPDTTEPKAKDTPTYTVDQLISSAPEILGQPDWLIRAVLTHHDMLDSDFLTVDEVTTAINDHQSIEIKPEPLPTPIVGGA